ncbi:MAG: SAM hydrolase/SAM-dependent halogenase family protein [Pyrinomonadaceae bacterium]
MKPTPIITLLTDFGTTDYFVGAMKGAILFVNQSAIIVDITHEIPPHDIQAGAFTLAAAYKTFPAGTIHVAVVDPGVGSTRRPLLIQAGEHFFVGPDNGLFGFVYEREAATSVRVFHLNRKQYFRSDVSDTFHGRDVFAPIAGALANGIVPAELGDEITDYVRQDSIAPHAPGDESIEASVIHIDRFGNCVTNLTRRELTDDKINGGVRLIINNQTVTSIRRFFAEETDTGGKLFAVWGSAGFLEIVAFCDSAARLLDIRRGQRVIVQSANTAALKQSLEQ